MKRLSVSFCFRFASFSLGMNRKKILNLIKRHMNFGMQLRNFLNLTTVSNFVVIRTIRFYITWNKIRQKTLRQRSYAESFNISLKGTLTSSQFFMWSWSRFLKSGFTTVILTTLWKLVSEWGSECLFQTK